MGRGAAPPRPDPPSPSPSPAAARATARALSPLLSPSRRPARFCMRATRPSRHSPVSSLARFVTRPSRHSPVSSLARLVTRPSRQTVDVILREAWRRERLARSHAMMRDGLLDLGLEAHVGQSDRQILTLVTRDAPTTQAFRDACAERGVTPRACRTAPPHMHMHMPPHMHMHMHMPNRAAPPRAPTPRAPRVTGRLAAERPADGLPAGLRRRLLPAVCARGAHVRPLLRARGAHRRRRGTLPRRDARAAPAAAHEARLGAAAH